MINKLVYAKEYYSQAKLKGDFARLNFPNLRHQGCSVGGGDFGEYKPLHSSVDAKLEVICDSLANLQKQGKSGESIKNSRGLSKAAGGGGRRGGGEGGECNVTGDDDGESEGSDGSSSLSNLTFADLGELQ